MSIWIYFLLVEHISIVQFIQARGIDEAIIYILPLSRYLLEVSFGLQVLGAVENTSGQCQPLSYFKFLNVTEFV